MKKISLHFLPLLVGSFFFFGMPLTSLAQDGGKLGGFEDDYGDDNGEEDSEETEDNEAWAFVFELFFDLVLRSGEYEPEWFYTDYPYDSGFDGFMIHDDDDYSTGYFTAQVRFQELDSDLHALAFDFKTKWKTIFGIDGNVTYFRETFDLSADTDELVVAAFHLNLLVIRAERFQLGIMPLGVKGIYGEGSHTGVDFGLSTTITPVKPIVLSGNANFAFIALDPLREFRGSLGVLKNRFELNFGYRALQSKNNTLHGPEIGFRLWL